MIPEAGLAIGTEAFCALRLPLGEAAPLHCMIRYTPSGAIELEDYGSALGTFINGQKARGTVELRGGDRVRVGRYSIFIEALSADFGEDETEAIEETTARETTGLQEEPTIPEATLPSSIPDSWASPLEGTPSREVLEARLEALERSDSLEIATEIGTARFDTVPPTSVALHTCSVCAQKTPHRREAAQLVEKVLPRLRTLAASLAPFGMRLDERALCQRCAPSASVTPQVTLVVPLQDGSEMRVESVTPFDLTILHGFLVGDTICRIDGEPIALRSVLERIRELMEL